MKDESFIMELFSTKKIKLLNILKLINLHQFDYSNLHPYVFSPKGESPTEVDVDNVGVLASPFPIFSVEVDGGKLTVDKEGLGFDIVCVFCKELSYDLYAFVVLVNVMGKDYIFETLPEYTLSYEGDRLVHRMAGSDVYVAIKAVVGSMLQRLHSGSMGLFNASGKAKFKDKQGRKQAYKPNDVIYIRDKSQSENISERNGRKVDWKNTWEVTCHWRKISPESLGKDREGNRVVRGATFIASYTKGIGDLLIRTRKVLK